MYIYTPQTNKQTNKNTHKPKKKNNKNTHARALLYLNFFANNTYSFAYANGVTWILFPATPTNRAILQMYVYNTRHRLYMQITLSLSYISRVYGDNDCLLVNYQGLVSGFDGGLLFTIGVSRHQSQSTQVFVS